MNREADVLSKVSREGVAELALQLSNIDSPVGREREVLEFVFGWLEGEGFSPRKVGMLEDRYNVVGRLEGEGTGYDLIFNAHVDTPLSRDDAWIQPNVTDRIWHSAWQDGSRLVGYGIVNDKGPLAATMMAAKAIKDSGVSLKGDLLVTAVCSETSKDPVDELQPPEYYSREIGAQYLVSHGVLADYALVAEATARSCTWIECGVLAVKLTVSLTDSYAYIPFLKRPTSLDESPNAIVRMARVIEAFEDWAYQFQQDNQREFEGGTIVPKASIVGIRGGDPTSPGAVIGVCSLYVKCYLPPGLEPLSVCRTLKAATDKSEVSVEVQPFAYNPGAEGRNIAPLKEAVIDAHHTVFREDLKDPPPEVSSMWRDCNVFNSFGIPSLTYGPGVAAGVLGKEDTFALEVEELYEFAKSYALVALNICGQRR